MSGYVKLNRKFFDNFLWNETRTFSKAEAWLDLIQSARFEASTEIIKDKVIELQRGELPASRRFLELRWNWGSTKVSNFLKILIDLGMANQRQASGQTIITLVNYGVYNDSQTSDKPVTEPVANQRQTSSKPAANQNKERKESKEVKNNKRKSKSYNPVEYLLELGASKEQIVSWIDFRRKVKKASVSKVVVDGIFKVACEVNLNLDDALKMQEERNWQGFKKEWIKNGNTKNNRSSSEKPVRTTDALNNLAARLEAEDRAYCQETIPDPDSVCGGKQF